MVSITLAVPSELKQEMDKHPELNWSEVARQAIRDKVTLLNRMDQLLSESRLTEEEAILLGRKVGRSLSKRYRKMV